MNEAPSSPPMEPDQYTRILDAGGTWLPLTQRQRWRALQEWRSVFAAPLHKATGKWKLHQFEWHVFSYKYTRALGGAKALAEYQAQRPSRIYLVPEDEDFEAGILRASRLPDFTGSLQ